MKKLFLTTVIFSVLLLIGCQENTITEPTQFLARGENSNSRGSITLSFVLEDPQGGSSQLTGEARYVHQILNNDEEETGLYRISLQLEMNSILSRLDGPVSSEWTINGQSLDVFHVSEEGIYILQKAYYIENRFDVVLVVQYLVTTEGVGVPNLWLELID